MDYLSLLVPVAYLGILIGSMATFSHLYRQRQVKSKLRLAPYFGPHTTRNVYLSLLHLQDDAANTKVPDSVLRAALLSRAIEDIQRIMEVRTRKPALAQLLQRGVVGDEIFQRLQRAEQELEVELKDVMAEANALAPGWGQSIFQSANEMVQNKLLRDKLDAIKVNLPREKEVWDAQREKSRKELEGESVGGDAQPAAVELGQQQQASAAADKVAKAGSSDEDGVIVETPPLEVSTPAGGSGGKNKKKKGKK